MLNKVYIPLFHHAFITGMSSVISDLDEPGNNQTSTTPKTIFFNSLIQGGASKIILAKSNYRLFEKELPINITKRIKLVDSSEEFFITNVIKKYLLNSLINSKDASNQEILNFVDSLSYDLGAIFYCSKRNLSLGGVAISRIDIGKIKNYFKEAIAFPLSDFINKIKFSKVLSPQLKYSFENRDIEILEEILSSDYYYKLSEEHNNLKNKSNNLTNTTREINLLSKDLAKNYDDKLMIREDLIYSLELGEKICPPLGVLTKLFNDLFNKEKRLILYDPSKMFNEIHEMRIKKYLTRSLQENSEKLS